MAQRALDRLNLPNAEAHFYFNAAMVLPVHLPGDFRLFWLTSVGRQAVRNWLESQWAPSAPGLKAVEAGSLGSKKQLRVQALVESHDPDAEMVFPPDPRYREHIISI
jgi:hypothetical protein